MNKLNLNFYKKKYPDLKKICKSDREYCRHWLKYGESEGRKGNDSLLYLKTTGGLGNQLFMIFNTIALSLKYDIKYIIDYDRIYKYEYLNKNNVLRKSSNEYNLLNKIKFKGMPNRYFIKMNEKNYKFNMIKLKSRNNYEIIGYYQSYKYFWDYKDDIKKILNIDYDLINKIKNIYSKFNKKILAIHLRLGDYKKLKNIYGNPCLNYYKLALSNFNLNEYQIILFSDDYHTAKEFLNPLNLNFIQADDIFKNDEEQFYMLIISDIKICANSTFSLMSCYFSEFLNIGRNEYYFPIKWFGNNGPSYEIYDLIPESINRFKLIDSDILYRKCAVIFFHKNIYKLYNKYWIEKSVNSILNQKNCIFDIFEVNYGNENVSVFKDIKKQFTNYRFYKKKFDTHNEAMIFLLNEAFYKHSYDFVFNTNLDDYYHEDRFQLQLTDLIKNNYLLNSTLWTYINQKSKNENIDVIVDKFPINVFLYKDDNFKWVKFNKISDTNNLNHYKEKIKYERIKENLNNNHNIICHPSVCFTKKFWFSSDKHGNRLKYRDDKPFEDLTLWKRAVNNNIKIGILNRNLVYYRIHESQIGSQKKNKKTDDTFKKPDNTRIRNGFLVVFKEENFYLLDKLSKNNLYNNKDDKIFFFIFIKKKLEDSFKNYMSSNLSNINYTLISYSNFKYDNIRDVKKLFGVKIDLYCDKFYIYDMDRKLIINETKDRFIFYSVLYKIKSKYDFNKYLEWFDLFTVSLVNFDIIIYTNMETYNILKNRYINIDNFYNIQFRIKELNEFELFKYKDIFYENTSKNFFKKNISYKLIQIWINRHLFMKEIFDLYDYKNFYNINNIDYYCYIDIGYFRDFKINLNLSALKQKKIYIGLIENNKEYIKNLKNKVIKFNKSEIEKSLLISQHKYSFGGGCIIVHSSLVNYWHKLFAECFNNFISANIKFKDDQTIIRQILFSLNDWEKFCVISCKDGNTKKEDEDWFPFRNLLSNKKVIFNDFHTYL